MKRKIKIRLKLFYIIEYTLRKEIKNNDRDLLFRFFS
jgi:hypothetical protein